MLLKQRLKDPVLPIYISGFLDLFGVSMILPLILSHCRALGASPTVTGILGSTYGALQLFTSPLLGQWSDVAGRRFTLLVCLFMTACGYSLFGMATTVSMMFVARIPQGIFKHSQNIQKSLLADITLESDRSTVMGHFNAASSIGFIVGPMVGGHLVEKPGGFYMVGLLAGLIFLINFGIILCFVSEVKDQPVQSHGLRRNDSSATSLKKLASDEMNFNSTGFFTALKAVDWTDLWDLYLIKFLLGASVIIFRSNFSLILIEGFNTTPKMNGYIISFSAVVSALVGFFTGSIAKYYTSSAKLLLHCAIFQGLTLFSLAISPTLSIFILSLLPLGMVTMVARVASINLTLQRGRKEWTGILMGFQQSCMSVARMISPLVAGLAQEVTSSGAAIIGVVFVCIAICLMLYRPQDPHERRKQKVE